jgi:hypothetical protein
LGEHGNGNERMKIAKAKVVAGRKHYGGGLYLQTGESGSASWLLRYQRQSKETWLGLGPRSVFSLEEARARARKAKQQIFDGIDPLTAKREQRARQELEASRSITFSAAAEMYYAQHESKWSNAKHRQAFLSTLQMHAYPILGSLPVATGRVTRRWTHFEPRITRAGPKKNAGSEANGWPSLRSDEAHPIVRWEPSKSQTDRLKAAHTDYLGSSVVP